jgi:hypothetical protein
MGVFNSIFGDIRAYSADQNQLCPGSVKQITQLQRQPAGVIAAILNVGLNALPRNDLEPLPDT